MVCIPAEKMTITKNEKKIHMNKNEYPTENQYEECLHLFPIREYSRHLAQLIKGQVTQNCFLIKINQFINSTAD